MKDEEAKNESIPEGEEDIVEFVFTEDGEEDLKATLKKFREDLKESREKEKEYLTAWQRERADFLNYKKGEVEWIDKAKENTLVGIVEDLLPVLDAFNMAMGNKEAWEKVDTNWRTGVEYIYQQFLKALSDNGVVPIEVKEGDTFDANIHEPMGNIETEEEAKDHTIASVVQQGYKVGERVLRPTRVKVFIK